jgi:O-antigen/teichoic acid export membrane protein
MPLVSHFVLSLSGLALFVMAGVALVGQPLLQSLIGEDWRTDTGFLLIALLPVICRVIASPVSSVLILTHSLAMLGAWQIGYFITTATVLLASASWLDFDGLLVALAISEFALYGIYLVLSIHAVRRARGQPAGLPATSP